MVGNVAFRSSAFGGFNREDVMDYVERSTKEHRESLDHLQGELFDAQDKIAELTTQNEELQRRMETQQSTIKYQVQTLQSEYQQIVEERDSLLEKTRQMDEMAERLAEMEQRFNTLNSMNEQQRSEMTRARQDSKDKDTLLADQEKEIASLQVLVSKMKRESDSYRAMCSTIGEIEMDMRYRTSRMEREAQERVDAKLAEAQSTYDNILASATVDALAIRSEMENQLAALKENLNSAAEEVNNTLTSALAEVGQIQNTMQHLNGCLDVHVGTVNGLNLDPIELLENPSWKKKEAAAE